MSWAPRGTRNPDLLVRGYEDSKSASGVAYERVVDTRKLPGAEQVGEKGMLCAHHSPWFLSTSAFTV
jgi:hypothetical protein